MSVTTSKADSTPSSSAKPALSPSRYASRLKRRIYVVSAQASATSSPDSDLGSVSRESGIVQEKLSQPTNIPPWARPQFCGRGCQSPNQTFQSHLAPSLQVARHHLDLPLEIRHL